MSDLVTLATVKAYLRIQTTAEDDLLAVMIQNAHAEIEAYLRRPIFMRSLTHTDHGDMVRAYGVLTELHLPITPVESGSVVIEDTEGTTVDDTTYTVDLETGFARAAEGYTFSAPPYAITYNAGLEARDDFELVAKPALASAMLDLLADAYQRRNPGAQAEGAGGGVYTQWKAEGIPERAARKLDPFRRVGVV